MSAHGHMQYQIDQLQESLIAMGELAGKAFGESIAALVSKDVLLAREVIQRDSELDRLEDDHEEHTVQLIALNQPVARDLRLLIAFLRINTSIERTGDLAVNIAQSTIRLADLPSIKPFVDIPRSYELVRAMWENTMQAFSNLDDKLAREVIASDDAVDRLNHETIIQLIEISRDAPEYIYQTTNLIGVSKALERIGDLAVDIANEVLFARRGEILRHARGQKQTA